LNVHDWNFLREDPVEEKGDHPTGFVEFLNWCKKSNEAMIDTRSCSFYIKREEALQFQMTFLSQRKD
jgi:hypothetical protein